MKRIEIMYHLQTAEGLYLEKIYLAENDLITDFGNNIKIHRKNHYKMTKLH